MGLLIWVLVWFNFCVVVSMLVIVKALRDAQADMKKSSDEVNKSIVECRIDMVKSFAEYQIGIVESCAEVNKSLAEYRIDMEKSFAEYHIEIVESCGELRGDMKVLGTRMDYLDKHMGARMNNLEGQVRDMGEELRGINKFLRRESVKDIESDKES